MHDLVFPCDAEAWEDDEIFSTTLQSSTGGDSFNYETAPKRPFYNLAPGGGVCYLSGSGHSSATIDLKKDAYLECCISRPSGSAICAFSRSIRLRVVGT